MRKGLVFSLILGLVALVVAFKVEAGKPEEFINVPVGPSNGRARVTIPDTAIRVAPGVFSLGTAVDEGEIVKGYAFVHYADGHAKPGSTCGNGVCERGENAKKCPADCGGGGDEDPVDASSCYGFLAKDAKWKVVEPYVVNPSNTEGLGESFVANNLADDIQKWEDAAEVDIWGGGSTTSDALVADLEETDGVNEVYFGEIDEPNVIGVTVVWGVFGGPPRNRRLVEWDMVLDQVDFDWSDDGASNMMDYENIVTHELGHAVGLDDLYTGECAEQTMYGYASEGETKKRDLDVGDVTGISRLY